MESGQMTVQSAELFYSSKSSLIGKTRLWLWVGGAISILIAIPGTKSVGVLLWVAAITLGVLALMDWFLRKQMHSGKVLATLDEAGIASPVFNGKTKHYRWDAIASASVTRVQNAPVLQLLLHPTAGLADKRSFLTGRNPLRPSLVLSALDDAAQERLLQLVQQHIHKNSRPGQVLQALDNQIAEERAYQERLKSFAPIPWLTYGLIAINALVWIAMLNYGGAFAGTPSDLLLRWGGNAASEVQRGQWWRMASAMFLHSGFMHVALNMLGLYSAGVAVERIYGHRLFALIYLGSGLVGSALSLHFAAQSAVSVGASGAVFGITGALLVALVQHHKQLPKTMGKQTLGSLAFFILYALAQGFGKQGIDNAAHVGGLVAGCLLAYVLPGRFDLDKYVRSYTRRATIGLAIAAGATIGVATLAPAAQVDQRGMLLFAQGMQSFGKTFTALQTEAQQVKAGELSERESDERSRTVYAPMMRKVRDELALARLPATDPRLPLLKEAQRMTELMEESLAMESVFPEGKPAPADPARMAVIQAEMTEIAQRIETITQGLQATKKK